MSDKIIEGIVNFVMAQIKQKLEKEAERITAEVITDAMAHLKFDIFNDYERMKTEIRFIFVKESDHDTKS